MLETKTFTARAEVEGARVQGVPQHEDRWTVVRVGNLDLRLVFFFFDFYKSTVMGGNFVYPAKL
jgi:hypothetical protein